MRKISLVLLMLMFFVMVADVQAKNMYKKFKKYDEVKLYLENVVNNSGAEEISEKLYRETFNRIAEGRVEVKFVVVNDPKLADAIVDVDITSYDYVQDAGVSVTGGMWGVVADTTAPKNECKVVAGYVLLDPETGKVITKEKRIFAVERMPKEKFGQEATTVATVEKNIESFLVKVFYPEKKIRT